MKHSSLLCCAALLIGAALSSCGNTAAVQSPAETGSSAPVPADTDAVVTEQVQKASLPQTMDLGGRDFTVLTKIFGNDVNGRWTSLDFMEREYDGDAVNDAFLDRNLKLEELFHCHIVNVFTDIGDMFSYKIYQTVSKYILSGDSTYDFIMPTIQDCAKLSADGMLLPLNDYHVIHLDAPWWNQTFSDATTIGENTYYADGDISETFIRAAYAIFFNKQAVTDYDLDDPYQLVTDRLWTTDRMMEMSRAAAEDLNGNGYMDSEDRVGLLLLNNSGEALYAASDAQLVTAQKDGTLTWTGSSARSIAVMEKIGQMYRDSLTVLNCDDMKLMLGESRQLSNTDRAAAIFSNGYALFMFGTMTNVNSLRGMETDFGILPLPMNDSTQDRYYSYIHTWSASAAAIPITASAPEESAAFMEAAAYYAKEIITPAYYDTALKTKYARDEASKAMLDLIYENRWSDLGNLYNIGKILTTVSDMFVKGKDTFTSTLAKNESKIASELEDINNSLIASIQ